MRHSDEYTYTAEWSDEDRTFTGTCLEFPGYSRTAPDSHLALQETRDAVGAALENDPAPPEPGRPTGEINQQIFLPVEERKLTGAVLCAAAQEGRISRTGAEGKPGVADNRQTGQHHLLRCGQRLELRIQAGDEGPLHRR